MAKITRKYQRVFAGDVTATNNISKFGSLKTGTSVYSDDPDVIQQLAAWGEGWAGAVINSSAPALQDFNSLFYVLTRQVAYMLQMGVAEYNATTAYYIGSLVSDGAGGVYKCLIDDTTGVALSDTTKWVLWKSDKTLDVSANYTVVYTDYMIRATGASDITITLPAATSTNRGRHIIVKSVLTGGANAIISGTIDGEASLTLSQYSAVELVSNGTGWDVI